MKIYPKKNTVEAAYSRKLTPTEAITRKIALGVAFISVFFFFIKLLFL